MPKQIYRIDQDGYFIEPVLINEDEKTPADCVEVFPTSGMYKQKMERNRVDRRTITSSNKRIKKCTSTGIGNGTD
jgi:hypothetical protein